MARTQRNDVHSPSNIIPADYEFVAQQCIKIEGIGDSQFMLAERKVMTAHMERTGGKWSSHEHGGNCAICGSVNAIYNVIFYHAKTNTYLSVGQDCAMELDAGRAPAFKAFRKSVNDYRDAQAGKRKAELLLSDAGHSAAWAIYTAERNSELLNRYEERTIIDIVGKLVKYGSVSDKAMAYIGTLLGKISARPALETKKAEEAAKAADAPIGRVVVNGEVLSTRWQESDFGTTQKMLVKDDSGYKVWVTVPTGAEGIERGVRVSFKVTLEPSKDDPKFAFGKRPVIQKEVTQ